MIQRGSEIKQTDWDALATLANSKAQLTGKPYRFLPLWFVCSNAEAMLRCWAAWGSEPAGNLSSGGFAVRTDIKKVFRLKHSDYTQAGSWQEEAHFKAAATTIERTALTGLAVGDFVYQTDVSTWFRLNALPATAQGNWSVYTGWSGELNRMRQAMFLFFRGNPTAWHFKDGEWYSRELGPNLFTGQRFSFPVSGNATLEVTNPGDLARPWALRHRSIRYVYPGAAGKKIKTVVTSAARVWGLDAAKLNELTVRWKFSTTKAGKLTGTIKFFFSFGQPPFTFRLSGSMEVVTAQASAGDNFNQTVTVTIGKDDYKGEVLSLICTAATSWRTGAGNGSADFRFEVESDPSVTGNHIHGASPVAEAVATTGPDGEPVKGYGYDFFGNATNGNQPGWLMTGSTSIDPNGAPAGYFWTDPFPIAWVNANVGMAALAPQASAAASSQDGSILVSSAINYRVPRMFFKRDTDTPNTVKLRNGANIVPAGSTVAEVHVRRTLGVGTLVNTRNAIPVTIGFIRSGAFAALQTVNIPAGQEGVTIYPDWINFTQDSLCYQCAERVDIQAALVAPSPAPGFDNPGYPSTPLPLAHFHYNTTADMLSNLT
jgi:hypothetical protein